MNDPKIHSSFHEKPGSSGKNNLLSGKSDKVRKISIKNFQQTQNRLTSSKEEKSE